MYSTGFSENQLAEQKRLLEPDYSVLVHIGDVYRTVNRYLAVLSVGAYAALIVICFKTGKRDLASCVLVILGMGLSMLVMAAGVCYTDLTAFPAVRY